jgi:hypothetical protein
MVSVNATSPFTFGSTDYIHVTITGLPIQGWSSNVVLSEDVGNREIAFQARSVASVINLVTSTQNPIVFSTLDFDTISGYNSSTGIYTIPESGIYQVSGSAVIRRTSTATLSATSTSLVTFDIIINGAAFGFGSRASSASFPSQNSEVTLRGGFTRQFSKGDQIRLSIIPTLDGGGTAQIPVSSHNLFSIHKISSPQTIAASEVVAARYSTDNTATAITSTLATIPYEDKILDTHNAYNPSTGVYTVPQSGYYTLSASIFTASFTPSSDVNVLQIVLQSVENGILSYINTRTGTVNNTTFSALTTTTGVFLSKGDQITVRISCSVSTTVGSTDAGRRSIFSISKITGV